MPSAFFLARVLSEMPTNVISALFYMVIIDTMAGMLPCLAVYTI